MSVKPPSLLAPPRLPEPVDALQYEIVGEKAATLARLARRFEAALAAFRAVEAEAGAADPARREALLAAAGEALWHLVIQRELCGFRNSEALMREYCVPAAVRLRMGVGR